LVPPGRTLGSSDLARMAGLGAAAWHQAAIRHPGQRRHLDGRRPL